MTRTLEPTPTRTAGPHWGRIVFGTLVVAVGTAWLLDVVGISVPWRFGPAAGLLFVGAVLLLSLVGGRGRADVVVLGVVLVVLATAVGVGAGRFAGPVGDRTVAPRAGAWPADTTVAAGTVEVDLTGGAPPLGGRTAVRVGAGRVVVRVPSGAALGIEARVVAGSVSVDDTRVREGLGLSWDTPGDPVITLDVGVGDVEVHRVGR